MSNIKLILLLAFLFMIGNVSKSYGAEVYQCNTDYTIYIPTTDDYQTATMPPITFYPDIIYNHRVNTNFTCGNATYQFGQDIATTYENIETNIYETKISGGNNAGQIVGYTQEFKFISDSADTWESTFSFDSKRGCTGTVTLYGYINNSWVQVESTNFTTYINYDKIIPDSKINGWKYVVHCTFNSNFTFLRYDNMYEDGYLLNTFRWTIKSSQQQAEDVQNQIEENTRQANGILGTIQNKIDGVVNKIQSVIDGITNLPNLIMDGLKDLLIPDDFTDTLTDNVDDLTDSLGVLGFPLRFVNNCVTTITNNDSMQLEVSVPTIGSPWGTLFPGYHRQNILYFASIKCFTNVGGNTHFSSLLTLFGLNYNSTIVNVVHAFTNLALFFALLRFLISKYNDIFDTDIDVGGDDD